MADFKSLADVPADIRSKFTERGSIDKTSFYSMRSTFTDGCLHLFDVLMDSSDRHEGILLKERWSFVHHITFSPDHRWVIRTLSTEEAL